MKRIGEHNLTDQQLVNRILNGDTRAFGHVIKNTERLVLQIVFKMIPRTDDRKDLVQDIYLKSFDHLRNFAFRAKLSTWIGQIAYNTCMNYLEKKKLVLPGEILEKEENLILDDPASGQEIRLSQKEVSALLSSEIDKLSLIYKTLIVLYHQEEVGYADIAQIVGLPEGTVKNYLFRARKKLKENILMQYKKEEL